MDTWTLGSSQSTSRGGLALGLVRGHRALARSHKKRTSIDMYGPSMALYPQDSAKGAPTPRGPHNTSTRYGQLA